MNHKRLESIFCKKHAPHMHAHKSRHTHASHVHTHDTMYASVYTCTHCGHKGHLAKFCYDRLNISNFASKYIWVRKGANPHGLKKVWVPKYTPIVFDVGVDSHLTWEYWCLDGGCVSSSNVHIYGCITFKDV